ncbi:hypothetical protein Nepgr_004202 [Nepenthes gracilis]|uniref:Uncharacterized protein n=1 Tax=Nepenthes gracilis TaxID=150966 RepID=A0AAD3S0X0_NEPGR|nr:hypothetical protein Nepgr_004202 [Nepenthes gracilis]
MGEGVAMPAMNNIISILGGSNSRGPVILSRAPGHRHQNWPLRHTWGTIIIRTWVPTYYNQVLKFHLMEFGLVAVLPWLTRALFAYVGGWMADTLVARGFAVTSVRKIMQSIEGLGPVFLLSLLRQMKPLVLVVLSLPFLQGLDAFSQSGLYSNHQDIGPRYFSSKSSVVAPGPGHLCISRLTLRTRSPEFRFRDLESLSRHKQGSGAEWQIQGTVLPVWLWTPFLGGSAMLSFTGGQVHRADRPQVLPFRNFAPLFRDLFFLHFAGSRKKEPSNGFRVPCSLFGKIPGSTGVGPASSREELNVGVKRKTR